MKSVLLMNPLKHKKNPIEGWSWKSAALATTAGVASAAAGDFVEKAAAKELVIRSVASSSVAGTGKFVPSASKTVDKVKIAQIYGGKTVANAVAGAAAWLISYKLADYYKLKEKNQRAVYWGGLTGIGLSAVINLKEWYDNMSKSEADIAAQEFARLDILGATNDYDYLKMTTGDFLAIGQGKEGGQTGNFVTLANPHRSSCGATGNFVTLANSPQNAGLLPQADEDDSAEYIQLDRQGDYLTTDEYIQLDQQGDYLTTDGVSDAGNELVMNDYVVLPS